jgi:hypothetical protein
MISRLIISFWKNWWQQLIGIPAALFLFFGAPVVYRIFDPSSASYDAGVLHIINLSMVELLCYYAAAWIGLIISFRPAARVLTREFETHLNNLSSWQKLKFSLSLLLAFCLFLVMLSQAMKA